MEEIKLSRLETPKTVQKNKSDTLSGSNPTRVLGGVMAKGITHRHLLRRLNGCFNDDRQSNFAASSLDSGQRLQQQRRRGGGGGGEL